MAHPVVEQPIPRIADEAARFTSANPDIEIVELLLPDSNGVFRGKWMPANHIDGLFRDGLALAKSVFALDAWGSDVLATGLYHETGDRDGMCRPVPGSLRRVPWAERPTAQVMLRMDDEDGGPFFADPRTLLEKAVARLAARGLRPVTAFELEFYLFADADAGTVPSAVNEGIGPDRTNIYSVSDLRAYSDLFAEIEAAAEALDVATDTIISEAAPGQFEINLLHVGDPFAAADQALMLRRIIRQVARKHGLKASFMAKPFAERSGNGMHAHVSLVDQDGRNVFGTGPDGEALLRRCVAGLLDTMHEATLLFVSTYNGFRRLSGAYSPSKALWAENNRYVAVRLPRASGPARRFEHRVAGADANPHLVLAAILAGAERGLAEDLPLPLPVEGDVSAVATDRLPPTMRHALDRFETSDWIADTFGAEWRDFYGKIKRQELEGFEAYVSPLEYETYL
ncbi:glutamine synthetase family protein [Microbaculum marinisediminis]|uniref:Glutamine synthetase family protein n=1 Tax=Microbaculum marinisediminis TaxID=2931392 RepID=A0AAW5QVU0_9HYPH|nr:glutamine synthetase family protein [Microbaculum sp. A6E488]MCT8970498.1 glutamine synthetase family protein [Microbaculum sp. A6E488]